MTSIDPRGPGRAGGDDRRRSLARSTLWSDAERGGGAPVGPQPLRARWDPVPPPRQRVSAARQPAPDLRTPPRKPRRRRTRRRSALGWFVHHYGWRAYAIPVLAALTVVAVIGLVNSPGSDASDEAADNAAAGTKSTSTVTVQEESTETVTVTQSGTVTTIVQTVGGGDGGAAVDVGPTIADTTPVVPSIDPTEAFRGVVMGVLPPGAAFAKTGAGTFHVIPGSSKRMGDSGQLRRFTIEVEDGITTPQADTEFAEAVMAALSGPGSWAAGSDFSLQRVDSGTPDFRISLTSQMTTRQAGYCGWDVQLEASCYNQSIGRVVINVARWVRGAYSYGDDMTSYREYAINHEVGHALGFHHAACPEQGGIAPVMMQQSWSTSDDDIAALNPDTAIPADGKVCRANPFAYPDLVS